MITIKKLRDNLETALRKYDNLYTVTRVQHYIDDERIQFDIQYDEIRPVLDGQYTVVPVTQSIIIDERWLFFIDSKKLVADMINDLFRKENPHFQ